MQQTRPWWQQPLVWFIIGLPATMVVIGFWLLGVALRNHDDLITSHPYEKGLQVGSVIDQAHHAAQLKLHASITHSGNGVVIELDPAQDDATLALHLAHPFDPNRDRSLTLTRVSSGVYSAQTELDPVLYTAQLQGQSWSLSGRWNPGTATNLWPGLAGEGADAPAD